jgi:hypothetical protein
MHRRVRRSSHTEAPLSKWVRVCVWLLRSFRASCSYIWLTRPSTHHRYLLLHHVDPAEAAPLQITALGLSWRALSRMIPLVTGQCFRPCSSKILEIQHRGGVAPPRRRLLRQLYASVSILSTVCNDFVVVSLVRIEGTALDPAMHGELRVSSTLGAKLSSLSW